MDGGAVLRVLSEIRLSNPNARLLAATKYADADSINELILLGVDAIGENRVQDAEKKFPSVLPCEKHFLGWIQSNKIRKIAALFDVVQSLCRKDHAVKLNEMAKVQNKKMRVLVQVNAGDESQKQGLPMEENALRDFLVFLKTLDFLVLEGLMVVVPEGKGPLFFPKAKDLFDLFKDGFHLKVLSMGTSDDYRSALENGATMVRVGRILFS